MSHEGLSNWKGNDSTIAFYKSTWHPAGEHIVSPKWKEENGKQGWVQCD